jgi:hypothetical protein
VRNAIKLAFFRDNIVSPEKLSKILEGESVHVILRKSREGQLYGITYVDHKTRSVFNGSSLGKEFSAKGIQESCALNILALERKYQNSISTSPENIQHLVLREYVKENLADILLRGEKIMIMFRNNLIKKRKKRIYKRI